MPQQQGRKPTFEELLQQTAPTPTPGRAPSFEELLQQSAPTGATFEQLLTQPQQPQDNFLTRLRKNVGIAGHRGMAATNDFVNAAGDIISGLLTGDTQPLKEVAKGVALRGQQAYAASQPGGSAAVGAAQAAIDRGAAEREAAQVSRGDIYPVTSAVKRRRLDELAAQDPSLSGKITRRAIEAGVASLPYAAAAPGGAPALAAVGAAMSLGEPENILTSAGLAALPLPSGRAIKSAAAPVIERIFAKDAAGALEVISAARKAGLLSSAKTHIRNVVGTNAFQLSEEAARMPGAVVDMLVSKATGTRTLTGPSLGAMRRSFQEAATTGVQEAKQIWRKGVSDADAARLGLNQEINSGSKILDTYINKSFRALSIEDKLVSTYAARRALESRAKAAALTEMRQGKIARGQVGERTLEILKTPPEGMAAAAAADAEVAVFTNENLVSKFLAGGRKEIEKLPGGRGATFAVDLIFPFTKTPSNVIARMLDYAGLGAAKESTKAIARRIVGKSMTPAQQLAFSQAWGRAGIGGGLIALGAIGYRDGWLTGLIEDDPGRRARDEAAGRIPGAINIGGKWLQLTGFAPLASLLAIGATLQRETDQEREGAGLLPVLEVGASAISEQPLLTGAKQIGESITKPGTTGERLLGGLVGSFVPTALSDVAEAVDPRQREASGILGYAQKRIPGARNYLPESRDVLGKPKQDYGPLQALFDPTRATNDVGRQNPVMREFIRLDLGVSKIGRKDDESAAEHRARVQAAGEGLQAWGEKLIQSDVYRQASDKDKGRALKVLVLDVRRSLDREGESWRLEPRQVFETLRESDERKRERERR